MVDGRGNNSSGESWIKKQEIAKAELTRQKSEKGERETGLGEIWWTDGAGEGTVKLRLRHPILS